MVSFIIHTFPVVATNNTLLEGEVVSHVHVRTYVHIHMLKSCDNMFRNIILSAC